MLKTFLKHKEKFILFGLTFALLYIYNILTAVFDYDNIWNFSMILKIAEGYIPYREINIIVPPVFHFIRLYIFKCFWKKFQFI